MALLTQLARATFSAIAVFSASFQMPAYAAPATLTAVKADAPPALDGIADDGSEAEGIPAAPAAEPLFRLSSAVEPLFRLRQWSR